MDLTNEQLNEWLAREVMGWEKEYDSAPDSQCHYVKRESGETSFIRVSQWSPTSDLNQSFECLKETGYEHVNITCEDSVSLNCVQIFDGWDENEHPQTPPGTATDESLSRAICEAIWKAESE